MNRRKLKIPASPLRRSGAERDQCSDFACSASSVAASLAVCLAVALLFAARRLGPLVIPAALTGAGLAAAELRRRGRAVRTQRLATWALHAPHGPMDPQALERLVAADIAVRSAGHPGAVTLARSFVRGAAADRWHLELALERLAGGDQSSAGRFAAIRGGGAREPTAAWLGIAGSLVVVLLTVPVSGRLSTAGVAVATATAVAGWIRLCDDLAAVPLQLAWTALAPPPAKPYAVAEPCVVELLAELAGGEVAVVDEAAALVKTTGHPAGIDLALSRMEAVRRAL